MDNKKENLKINKTLPKVNKINVLVIGDKKTGKTTLIKSFFEFCRVQPETNFLIDSVKIWEGNMTHDKVEYQEEKISFIEMDTDVKILDQISKFEEVLKGNKNFLCFVMKVNSTNSNIANSATLKIQSRIKLFFEKFYQLGSYFNACVVVNNKFMKKKEIFNVDGINENEKFIFEVLNFQSVFKSKHS